MPLGRCGTGVPLEQLHPGDAAEVRRFRACLADVAERVKAGTSRDDALQAAYRAHYPELYPEDARPSDDVENQAETREDSQT